MRRLLSLGFVVAVFIMGLTSLASAAGSNSDAAVVVSSGEYSENVVRVRIQNFAYTPSEITIEPGTTVVWEQREVGHNVHIGKNENTNELAESIVSKMLSRGETFAVTFNAEGIYEYICDPHPFMYGKITVKASE